MDVLAIILACSLHHDDALVRTLVDVQSGGNVYFVGDLATLKTNDSLTSADAALRYAEEMRRHGGRPAVGLLGVPLDWAGRYGRAPIELFDACTNIAIASAALAEYHDRCSGAISVGAHSRRGKGRASKRRNSYSTPQRFCVLSSLARDLGLSSAPAAILGRLEPDRPASVGTTDAPPQRSLLFIDGAARGGSDSAARARSQIFLEPPASAVEAR
jgi:hypothetical protein